MTRFLTWLFWMTVLGIVFASAITTPAHAQTAPPGAIAWTECLNGRVATYVNAAILGTDSTEEILYHESIHFRQNTDSIAKTGVCAMIISPAQLLNYEIEAYCASDSVRIRVKHTPKPEVRAQTVWRLMRELHSVLPVFTITDSWNRGCPE